MSTPGDIVASLSLGPLPRRALTPEAKRAIVERLLAAWLRCPDLRLGQMIAAGVYEPTEGEADLFSIEDATLIDSVERFARCM